MKTILYILLSVLSYSAFGQSYFYNTQQFGLQSTLLGGAVTAGSSDLSMAYYNPAALRYAKGKGFDLALFMPSFSVNNYGDFFNSGEDLKSTDASLNPSLITYKTDIKDVDIVFTILQKDVWDNNIAYNANKSSPLFEKLESFRYTYKGDEKWFGVASHMNLGEGISLGLSQFWSLRSARYEYHISSEVLANSGSQLDFFYQNLDLSYSSHFSLITKLGISFDRPHDRIGVVITSPYYSSKRNSAKFQQTTSILKAGTTEFENIVDFNLHPTLNSGWQLDFGYAKILRDSSELWLNGSYHSSVGRHSLVEVDRINKDPLTIGRGMNAVTNISIGHARFISPNIQLIGSLRTNFNAFKNDIGEGPTDNMIILEDDRIQLALGCKVRSKTSSFVVGVDYGFSLHNAIDQFEQFPNIDLFETGMTDYGHRSLTILLTYEFFLDTVGDNISRMFDGQRNR